MESHHRLETISEVVEKYLGLPALLLGFIVDILALLAVFGVQSGIVEGRLLIGPIIQLTIWTTALVAYIGYLREYWRKELSKGTVQISTQFTSFLLSDLPRLRFPYHWIPIVILFGFLANILVNHPGTTILFIIIGLIIVFSISYQVRKSDERVRKSDELASKEEAEWTVITDDISKWIDRITVELEGRGYITHIELSHNSLETLALCSKALAIYCHLYEDERDLVLIDELIENRFVFPYYLRLHILTVRSLSQTRPWMNDTGRYFKLKPRWM